MNDTEAMLALRELAVIAPALPAEVVADRATAILDRSALKVLPLHEFLAERGYEGADLARIAGPFAAEASEEYLRTYGARPLKRWALLDKRWVRENAYISSDREVLERALERTLAAARAAA